MNVLLRFALILFVAITMAGCKTRVQFPLGSPYQTRYKVDDGVVISYPDTLQERTYRARVGSWFEGQVFIVPLFDAYRTETVARMNGIFTRGVTMTTHKVLEEINASGQEKPFDPNAADPAAEATEDAAETEANVDRVLAELEKKESGDKTVKLSQAELMDEALRQAEIEMVGQKDRGYLLRFKDALYGMPDQRIRVSFYVQLIDRRTGSILLEKRYSGLSPRFAPSNNNKTNEARMVALTKLAFNGAMTAMVEDIAKVTGVWTPKI